MNVLNLYFTEDEIKVAEKIITFSRHRAAKRFTYLSKGIYYLKPEATGKIRNIGANYSKLFYNPGDVIRMYDASPQSVEKCIVHCVLHCMLLHPSFESQSTDLFEKVSDTIVNAMLESTCYSSNTIHSDIIAKYNAGTTTRLLSEAVSNTALRNRISAIHKNHKIDDHNVWYLSEFSYENNSTENSENTNDAEKNPAALFNSNAEIIDEQKKVWQEMFISASTSAGMQYGNQHGNLFMSLEPPDRFSKFSYFEYLRKFAIEEIVQEDPETFDMILYTAGLEMYDDMPIVEWNEIRESINTSDIIIAIDMSGSCSGDVATNFLRQVYSLFNEIDIRGSVNIHVVSFDTEILNETVIRNRNDAEKFIDEYNPTGFGGTSFECVFDYADKFSEKSQGKKLKGLFFFSDAEGFFPDEKKNYQTTFFVPENEYTTDTSYDFVPDWIELVHYNDNQ